MKTITLAMLNWLHLIATVTWIGGITFVLFIAMPSAKELLGPDAGKIMGIISRRFTLYAAMVSPVNSPRPLLAFCCLTKLSHMRSLSVM